MNSALLVQWLFVRLSRRFTIPFALALAGWMFGAFPWLARHAAPLVQAGPARLLPPAVWLGPGLDALAGALVVVALFLLGPLLALWTATAAYRLAPPRPVAWERPRAGGESLRRVSPGRALGRYERIGLVLAGGGAKGAYQAGAMAAIHRFLVEREALERVTCVAATSIGAWNACFWLADRLADGDPGCCERWWSRIRLSEVVAPTFYLPAGRDWFLAAAPWRAAFRTLFADDRPARERLLAQLADPDAPGNARFYLTRTNVETARLEFGTNRPDLIDVDNATGRERPLVPDDRWTRIAGLEDLERAVFASMDIPPLFQNVRIGDELFEDGGVIDNLPIYFGTGIEKCDLLFVLPLHASFAGAAEGHRVLKRLERTMTIRQGALERKALKDVYLYNELAALRQRLDAPDGRPDAERTAPMDATAVPAGSEQALHEAAERTIVQRAARRVHRPVQVFAVAPDEPLLLDTMEFWKTAAAGRAFRLMEEHTRTELERFDFEAPPNWIRVAAIGPYGDVRYVEDF